MGKVLDTYRRYRALLAAGDFAHLTEVVDENWVENCVGLTGWTIGLDVAVANFSAGIAAAFSSLENDEEELIETNDTLVIRGRGHGTHVGAFLDVPATQRRVSWDYVEMFRLGADQRIQWHFFVSDWNYVREQLLGRELDLPTTPTRRAVVAERAQRRS